MNGRILSAQLQAAFDRFKAAYPPRPGNPWAPAGEVFARLIKAGEDAEALIGAAGVFAAECKRRGLDPEFIPHARTWLKQRRFEDYSAPADAAPSADDAGHPLAFLRAVTGPDYFASWIAPLRLEIRDGVSTVVARTNIARDRVERDFGPRLVEQLGEVVWTVERTG